VDGWIPHSDGFIKGNVGVFPYLSGWEVWDNIDGEWRPRANLPPFRTIEAAKAAAEKT
jgi:hypothetical protein